MIYHETEHGVLYHGDCLDIMKTLPDNSVDAVVTDPPYGLGFMGKAWDTFDKSQFGIAGNEGENDLKVKKNFNVLPRYKSDGLQDFVFAWASECLRVLKPGGYLLSFAGTRTQHRIACGIEDAGFEIRDMIAWVYGSGFPKSLNVGNGYGTALKPAHEPITVARKPIEGTVAANVLKWGTGAINIDGCRVGSEEISVHTDPAIYSMTPHKSNLDYRNHQGRFPANLIHDGSDEVLELFPESKSAPFKSATTKGNRVNTYNQGEFDYSGGGYVDRGSAARFFYCAKASKAERNAGCEGPPDTGYKMHRPPDSDPELVPMVNKNYHPTVKPIALMEYLIKLVAREGQTVLDPFLGSGTTAMACVKQGRKYIGCEMDKDYCEIAVRRIESELNQTDIFREES